MKKYIALIITLLILIGLPYWVIKNPHQAWDLAQDHLLPKDLHITWEDMNFEAKHISGLNFYINWEIHNLLIQKEKPGLDLPVDVFHVEARIFPRGKGQKLTLQNLILQTSKPLTFHPAQQAKKGPEQNPFEQLQGILSKVSKLNEFAKIENANIEVREFFLEKDFSPGISVTFSAHKKADSIFLDYQTTVTLRQMKLASRGKLSLENSAKVALHGIIDIEGYGATVSQNIILDSTSELTQIELQGPIKFQKNKLKISSTPKTSITLTSDNADLKLHSDILGLPDKTVKIRPFDLKLHVPFVKGKLWSRQASDLDLAFPIEVFIAEAQMKSPEIINGRLQGKVWFLNLLSTENEKQKAADLHLSFEDFKNDLLFIKAAADIEIFKENKIFTFVPVIDASAKLNSLQRLHRFLDAKHILIPAPLDALDGPVSLVMKGPVQSHHEKYVFPAELEAQLSSNKQILDVKTSSSISLSSNLKAAHADIHVVVNHLRLLLPPLTPVQGKPRIIPDKRILKEPKLAKTKNKFQFTYSLDVQTKEPGAIQLLSDYFDPYLPLTVHFKTAENNPNGDLTIEPFTVEYLRRKVHVEKFNFDITNPKTKPIVIDGRLRVEQTDYTVFIDITGTTDKPHIILSSKPYLPRSEIISVLLYDRTTEDLIAADAETAGQVEAAVADRAIGLLGIWVFASTPIRGFSYNPITKVYTATVQLPDNVVASVGTNLEESTQVELRKRISKRWIITAAWIPTDENENELTKLVLQWEKRF
jgi:hypothetical protein